MKVLTAAFLSIVLLTQGCAQIQYAAQRTPERFEDAIEDPVRRLHVVSQVGLSLSSGLISGGCALLAATVVGLLACPIAGLAWYYGMYEFILEPWSKARVEEGKPSLVGPYWERGPQDGETFVRP